MKMRVRRKRCPSPSVVGLAGKAAGPGWMWGRASQPGGEETVKLGVTRQKGWCQVKQNALPVPGMGPKPLRFTIPLLSADIPETHWWNIQSLRNTHPQKMKTRSACCINCPLQGLIKASTDSPPPNTALRHAASSFRLTNVLLTQLLGRDGWDG